MESGKEWSWVDPGSDQPSSSPRPYYSGGRSRPLPTPGRGPEAWAPAPARVTVYDAIRHYVT